MLKKEEEKLNQIKSAISELNTLAMETTKEVITCLENNDIDCLKDIKLSAKKSHAKSVEIDNIRTFLKKFAANYTKDIEKDSILEYTIPMIKACYESLVAISEIIKESDHEKVESLYQRISIEESKTDDLYSMIEKNILQAMNANHNLSLEYFNLLSALRRVERFADRTLSIASILLFAKTGKELEQL